MKIEFTNEQVNFLWQIINELRFPGSQVEQVYDMKKRIEVALSKLKVVEASKEEPTEEK